MSRAILIPEAYAARLDGWIANQAAFVDRSVQTYKQRAAMVPGGSAAALWLGPRPIAVAFPD